MLHKRCSICKEWIKCNKEYFYKNSKNKSDGFYPYCKSCSVEKSKKWNKDNNEKTLTYQKKRNDLQQNREKRRLSEKRRREQGLVKEWWVNNKYRNKKYMVNHTNHKITQEEWEACLDYFDWSCAYCGYLYDVHLEIEGQQLHKDHINHNGHDYIDNCAPACRTCNTSKHDKEFNEWYNENNPSYKEERLSKIIHWLEVDWIAWTE